MRWLAICCLSCLLSYPAVEGKQLGTSAPAFIWGSASHLAASENGQKHWVSYEVLALFAPCLHSFFGPDELQLALLLSRAIHCLI